VFLMCSYQYVQEGCYGILMWLLSDFSVLLCGCYGVGGGCQGVAIQLLRFSGCVFNMQLSVCLGQLLWHFSVVSKVF